MVEQLPIEAVARYLLADASVLRALRKEFGVRSSLVIDSVRSGIFQINDLVHPLDFLCDMLRNESRLYTRFHVRGSFGSYPVDVRGLGGVYYFHAPEFGSSSYFLELNKAEDAVVHQWVDTLVSARGRRYRPAFENCSIEMERVRADQEKVAVAARELLQGGANLDQAKIWTQLLQGPPIHDAQLCADLLEKWHASEFSEDQRARQFNDIVRVLLSDLKSTLSALQNDLRVELIALLTISASKSISIRAAELERARGVARLGAANHLDSARRAAERIRAA